VGDEVRPARQSHGEPETGPPGGLTYLLRSWEASGGRWRVLDERNAWITVGLYARDGHEPVGRVTAARTAVLNTFLARNGE
jgi:hypothetical protein